MYKIAGGGGGVQKSFSRTDPDASFQIYLTKLNIAKLNDFQHGITYNLVGYHSSKTHKN